jgi:hypothetical protein
MATSSRIYKIFQGTPVTDALAITLLGIGSAGTPGAKHILTHPDDDNFPPITYHTNPDRVLNMDNNALRHPVTTLTRTIGSTRLTRFERLLEDVIVTELWFAPKGKAAMPASQWRMIYEYLDNPPPFSATTPEYIQYQPQSKNSRTFNVQFVSFGTGSVDVGDGTDAFDVLEVKGPGGVFNGGDIANALDSIEEQSTGLIDRGVALRMRLISEVTS